MDTLEIERGDGPAVDVGTRLVTGAFAFTLAITVTLAAYVYAGAPYAVMALVTWCLAVGGWLSSSRHDSSAVPVAFDLYIATLVALMALYSEEWYRRFPSTLMRYFPQSFPSGVGIGEHAFVAVFPLSMSAAMTLGAAAYYRRTPIGELAVWVVFSWGAVAAVTVYAVGLFAGDPLRYVGGMVTAPAVFCVALFGMLRLDRRAKDAVT